MLRTLVQIQQVQKCHQSEDRGAPGGWHEPLISRGWDSVGSRDGAERKLEGTTEQAGRLRVDTERGLGRGGPE